MLFESVHFYFRINYLSILVAPGVILLFSFTLGYPISRCCCTMIILFGFRMLQDIRLMLK